MFYRQ